MFLNSPSTYPCSSWHYFNTPPPPVRPGTTAFTWRPRVTCSRTSASLWSTFTSWRQTRPARSFWRKFQYIEFPNIVEVLGSFTLPMFCLTAIRPKLVVQRRRRPVSAERSVSRPRKRRSSRTCPRRRRQPRSNLTLTFLRWLSSADNKNVHKTLMTSRASFVPAVLWSACVSGWMRAHIWFNVAFFPPL